MKITLKLIPLALLGAVHAAPMAVTEAMPQNTTVERGNLNDLSWGVAFKLYGDYACKAQLTINANENVLWTPSTYNGDSESYGKAKCIAAFSSTNTDTKARCSMYGMNNDNNKFVKPGAIRYFKDKEGVQKISCWAP
jgi:hypothetical protein